MVICYNFIVYVKELFGSCRIIFGFFFIIGLSERITNKPIGVHIIDDNFIKLSRSVK